MCPLRRSVGGAATPLPVPPPDEANTQSSGNNWPEKGPRQGFDESWTTLAKDEGEARDDQQNSGDGEGVAVVGI